MNNVPSIGLTLNQLTDLIRAPESVFKDLMDARERVLKLEHKLNELYDMLTDFRVNQVMGKGGPNIYEDRGVRPDVSVKIIPADVKIQKL